MSQFSLLASRRFWPLFWAQFLGALNDNIFRFALVIFITFRLGETSALPASELVVLSGGIFILPFFLFSALAGQLADRFEKSRIIRLVKLSEIVVMGLGAVGFHLESAGFLLGVLFLMGTHSAFFGPLKYGILPQHLAEDELTGGNALIQMATYIAILTGAMLGGTLAVWSHSNPLPVIAAVLGVAITGYVCARQVPAAAPSDANLGIDWRLDRATWRLLRDALRSRELAALQIAISWFWFLGATCLSLVPSFGKDLLKADESAVTLLNAAFTLGIGFGSLWCEWLSRRRVELGLMLPAAIALVGVMVWVSVRGAPATSSALDAASLLGHPGARAFFLALVGLGAAGAVYVVPLNAALQARAEPQARARIIAGLNVLNAAFMVGSALYTTLLLRLGLDLTAVFGVTALLTLAVAVALAFVLPEFATRARALLGLGGANTFSKTSR
jgi:MFS family permease